MYQLPDKTWVASMEAPGSGRGNRKRIVRKAKTKRDALAKLEDAKRDLHQTGTVPDQRTTVATFLAWWLSDVVPGTVRESTLEGYRWITNKYLVPNLGTIRLAQLSPQDVQSMLRALEKQGLSPRTRRHARSTLVGALRRAQRFGMVTRNVAALVDPPRLDQADVDDDTLTAKEVRKLLAHLHAQNDRLVLVAELAIRLGMRRGELLALRWRDVDTDNGTLRVSATLKHHKVQRNEKGERIGGGGWYLDEPKTKAGDRVVPLSDHLVAQLKAHRKRQAAEQLEAGANWQKLDFVFTTPVGTPIDGRNLVRWWSGIFKVDEDIPEADRLGIAARPFHATRRTAVTLMAEAGVPLQVAANIVGHSSIRMTAEIYNRVQPRAQQSALDALEAHIGS